MRSVREKPSGRYNHRIGYGNGSHPEGADMVFRSSSPESVLFDWLSRRLSKHQTETLQSQLQQAVAGPAALFLAFGTAPRKYGKGDLHPTAEELAQAGEVRPGWNPAQWSIDQAVRTLLVCSLNEKPEAELVATLDKLFAAASVEELVALYQAMGLWSYPKAHAWRAGEGIRSSMTSVFVAVAHRNPFPAEQLEETAWNQMIVKCLFVGVPLHPVVGINRRSNPKLMKMLVDYAHERWAAKRSVNPELWRCVGPHADARAIADLQKVLETGTDRERRAAALALKSSPDPKAVALAAALPENPDDSWEKIGQTTFI
jgi:hypothetical protein